MKRSMRKLLPLLLAVAVVPGCKKDAPALTSAVDAAVEEPTAAPTLSAEERCVDDWLRAKKLDEYGSEEGTMYTGGSPLFNETTGERRDRLEFVYERQPEAKAACSAAGTAR